MSPREPKRGDFVEVRRRSMRRTERGWLSSARSLRLLESDGRIYHYDTSLWSISGFPPPPCVNCWKAPETHVNEQCLFQSTRYQPATFADARVRVVESIQW